MAEKRNAQTLLSSYRDRFQQYQDVDDATLLSAIQKKFPQYKDISMETLPHSENFLQTAIRKSGLQDQSRAILSGGPSLGVMSEVTGAKNIPEALPSAGQLIGNIVGTMYGTSVGHPVRGGGVGGTLGRGIFSLGEQAIDSAVSGSELDLKKPAAEAGVAALTETVGAGLGGILNQSILKTVTGTKLLEGAGKTLGKVRDTIKSMGIKVDPEDTVNMWTGIQDDIDKLRPGFVKDKRLLSGLKETADEIGALGDDIDFKELLDIKGKFDSIRHFASGKVKDMVKDFNVEGVAMRASLAAGKLIDKLVKKSGTKDSYNRAVKVYSRYAKKYPPEEMKKGVGHKLIGDILGAGSIYRLMSGDIGAAASTATAAKAVGSESLRKGIYNVMQPLGVLGPTASAELPSFMKRALEKSRSGSQP